MANRRQARLILFPAALILIAVLLVGCDKKMPLDGVDNRTQNKAAGKSTNPRQSISPKDNTLEKPSKITTDSIELTLYFSDDQAEKLVKEVRKVSKTSEMARAAINELIAGPTAGGVATIPEGTRLLDVNVKNGQATINLSKEFIDNHLGGSAGERLTIYSIVNTLTELRTIKVVEFRVEGESVETISGHMDVSQPIGRDESIL